METCRRCADVCVRTWASVCLAYWTRGPVHTNSRALIPLTASKPTTLTWPHTEIWFSKKPISEEINDICVPFNHFYYKHLQCMVYENAAHCHCSFTKGKYTKNVLFFSLCPTTCPTKILQHLNQAASPVLSVCLSPSPPLSLALHRW